MPTRYPFTPQTTIHDDAASCLMMLSKFYRVPWPIEDIRAHLLQNGFGKTHPVITFVNASKSYFVSTTISPEDLDLANLPLVVYLPETKHFVVL